MTRSGTAWSLRKALVAVAATASCVQAADVLTTSGFTDCGSDTSIKVERLNISYDKDNRTVIFDVAGTSAKSQNVTAVLDVKAYGNQIYTRSFNPCDASTYVDQLCPLPVGQFAAKGTQEIPAEFAKMVPSIAFQVPDISAQATLELKGEDNKNVACIQSAVTNGKTASVPAVSYIAAGVAGAALIATGVSAAGAALSGSGAASGSGAGTMSPSFTEVVGWFQGMAMNGMLSVNYPPVYRSFTKNFGFSTGIIPWVGMQRSIDNMRSMTGGNLTEANVDFIQKATLIYPDGSASPPDNGIFNRKRDLAHIIARAIETSVNGTDGSKGNSDTTLATPKMTVQGIQAYAQRLAVPQTNVFMTALLVVAIIIAAIVAILLLVKIVLEVWAIWGSFPKALTGFRKHYWQSIGRTITQLILLLYGIWVLYCVFQFIHGDSWLAKTLAGVTLGLFTAVLAFFSWKIYTTVQKLKAAEGDVNGLYENKETWMKYSIFYDDYRRGYWWLFLPAILYMFAKGMAIAVGDGHGMSQTIAQLVIEGVMLSLLVWSRPFARRSGNVINITIQVVRVLSIVCILVFVEQFGIAQTTKTITGVVLIVVQSVLTGVLAILICWNAINACCKANPHRKRRKDLEKLRDGPPSLHDLSKSGDIPPPNGADHKSYPSVSTIDEKDAFKPQYEERFYSSAPAHHDMPPSGVPRAPGRSLTGTDAYANIQAGPDREPRLPNVDFGPGRGQQYQQPSRQYGW